jgi:hypothetical protein
MGTIFCLIKENYVNFTPSDRNIDCKDNKGKPVKKWCFRYSI